MQVGILQKSKALVLVGVGRKIDLTSFSSVKITLF